MNNYLKIFKTKYSPNLKYFVIGLFLSSIISTALHGTFHNYLNDIFNISADKRGLIEFPRELPGLLAVFIIALIIFLGEIKILALSIFLTGLGLLGLGYFSINFYVMIVFMTLWSTGMHLHMSLREPVAMSLSKKTKKGTVLGKINGIRSAGIITGTLVIWIFMGHYEATYAQIYLGAFILCILAAIFYSRIKNNTEKKNKHKFKLVFKKRYTLFYLLAATFGIRKQLFIVLAPWLLIKLFNQRPQDIAKLLFISSAIGIFLKPYMGTLIDKFGERKVLFVDAILIIILSSTYALSPKLFTPNIALLLLYICFIIDDLLFSLRTARTTYLYKILETRDDLTPTLSMGLSIEHIVSMTTPILAGMIWIKYGYHWVFIISAIIACYSAYLALRIPKEE